MGTEKTMKPYYLKTFALQQPIKKFSISRTPEPLNEVNINPRSLPEVLLLPQNRLELLD